MSFALHFDYRFDSTGFFDDPDRRAALEAAGAEWEAIIQDDFAEVPTGTVFSIRNPTTSVVETVTLDQPVDDIVIFVGATHFNSSILAIAGPDGGDASGDIYAARISPDFRGTGPVTDFEPWAGSITFDLGSNWSFDIAGPVAGQNDFLSVAVHEIGHILGIGSSGAFDRWIIDDHFAGPNAIRVNNGQPIPVEEDHAHVKDGFADDSVLLDPVLITGTRVSLSAFDKALLADIGYQVVGFERQGSTPAIASAGAERVFGTDLGDIIDGLDGNDTLQGADGDDQLRGSAGQDDLFGQNGNDTLLGGHGDDYLDGGAGDDILHGGPGADVAFGGDGRDVFVIAPGDGSNRLSDFNLGEDRIHLVNSGFTSAAEAIEAITKPFSNMSRITLDDGTTVDVFHSSRSGTPLTSAHVVLVAPEDDTTDDGPRTVLGATETSALGILLDGTVGDDDLIATAFHDRIDGGAGVDIVRFTGSQSSYTVTLQETGLTVTDRTADGIGTLILDNVEQIDFEFADPLFNGAMDLRLFAGHRDLDPVALNAFVEIYIAYFNRAPDAVGLGFWGTAYANGTSLEDIAALFAGQAETAALYPEDLSNLRFISEIYQNVLGRAPDLEGVVFWETALDAGTVSRDRFILELLNGAKADLPHTADASLVARQAADRSYLEMKTELGAQFALDRGLSDLDAALQVMDLFDGSAASFEAASALIEDIHVAALDPENGSFLMPLVGIQTDLDVI
ncbi:hypothetical protein GCM10011363_32380 [Marivita lacus]|uniref:DUF4214 domain-containing protein n=1 Tax=Marivita lacus TaxID=1323742 RepID=A0ABQ1KZQ6_9RHOB|nr:DUF4214 domain-containing protein [Marivita lacus]GGC13187.1 hypothetical protein GCM10011363_32380 [Marivita lacus]